LACELELKDPFHVNRFLTLFLEFELHAVLCHSFDWLAGQFTACLFEVFDVHRAWVAKQADDIGASNEDDTLALSLEDVSV